MNASAHVVAWSCLLALVGCGGASQSTVVASTTSDRDGDQAARALAPDLAVRVDEAEAAAAQARADGDDAAIELHRSRIRLWRTALHAEAERIGFERERATLLQELEAIESARIADEAARQQLDAETRREQAAAIARAEATRVLLEAEPDEARRRGGEAARTQARQQASRALLERAAVIVAAAVALGASDTSRADTQRAIDEAQRKNTGTSAGMNAAQKAFEQAQRMLASARLARGGPDAAELSTLLAELSAQGFVAELLDDGLVIWLAKLFAASGAELRSAAPSRVQALSALLIAHPHGPVQVQAIAHANVPPKRQAQRAQRVVALLRELGSARVSIVEGRGTADHDNLIKLTLPAYGCSALNNEAAGCLKTTAAAQ